MQGYGQQALRSLWWAAGCWSATGPDTRRWEESVRHAARLLEPAWADYVVHGQYEGLQVVSLLLYAEEFQRDEVPVLEVADTPLPDLLRALDADTVGERIATGLQRMGHDLDDTDDTLARAYQGLTYSHTIDYDREPDFTEVTTDSVPVAGTALLHGVSWARAQLIRHHLLELSVDP